MIFIFSYNRHDMLLNLIDRLKPYHPWIIDDGSDFSIFSIGDYDRFMRFKHGGKRKFWQRWKLAFEMAEGSTNQFFLFMPDDFQDIDYDKITDLHYKYGQHGPYVYNIINDGRTQQWVSFKASPVDSETMRIGFTDCGFFCNREALEKIGFHIDPIPELYFRKPSRSSGVGMQLTRRLIRANVPIYKPIKSLAFHGDHKSLMHPSLREIQPLISL